MKFVKRFKTETDYNSYMGGDRLILPNISLIDEVSEMSEEDSGVRFNPLPPPDPTNGHEYVDLGLPSGLKWAKCNIGAEKESNYGLYFQWGDVVGYRRGQVGSGEGKKYFDWSDYKYCNGSNKTLTKYNNSSSYGTVDNLTTLELSDDAASVNMGGSWRMPSLEEYEELLNNTTNTMTTVGGEFGRLLTSKTNNKTLFFPCSGYCQKGALKDTGGGSYQGYYWSSSVCTSGKDNHYSYIFYTRSEQNLDLCMTYKSYRSTGCAVRGVIE